MSRQYILKHVITTVQLDNHGKSFQSHAYMNPSHFTCIPVQGVQISYGIELMTTYVSIYIVPNPQLCQHMLLSPFCLK